ncbi:MAG: HEAT repeat domain-containing protein [Chthonomonadales bacterium]
MKTHRPAHFVWAAGLAALAYTSAWAQEDPFQALKHYDFQDRRPFVVLYKMAQEAHSNRPLAVRLESGLIGVLKDPGATYAGKREACRFLWMVGTARSVPVLARMLADPKLADMARYGLERNPDPSAGAALRSALSHATGTMRVGLINSLGDRRDTASTPMLARLCHDRDGRVAEAAIAALGKIATPAAYAALNHLPQDNLVVGQARLSCLRAMIASGRRRQAIGGLMRLTAAGQPWVVRLAAAEELVRMRDPHAAQVAFSLVKAPEPRLQVAAAHLCGSLPDAASTDHAIRLAGSLGPSAQTALITALADRHVARALPLALELTKSEDPVLRVAAIQAAGHIGGRAAVDRLAAMIAAGVERDAAREALATMRGPAAEAELLRLASDGSPDVRAALMPVLAERPSAGALRAMLRAASSGSGPVAVEALRALGRVATGVQYPELVKDLVNARSDDARDAAQTAVVATAQRMADQDRALGPLLDAYPSASPQVQSALLGVMAQIGGERALQQITQATASTNDEVRHAAVSALADTWQDVRALPTLLQIARTDPQKAVRVQALRGYLRLVGEDQGAPPAERVRRIKEALAIAERPEEKVQALSILRDCRVPEAASVASDLLKDREVAAEAADTILDLAARHNRNNRNLPAVTGEQMRAALAALADQAPDPQQKDAARKLLNP